MRKLRVPASPPSCCAKRGFHFFSSVDAGVLRCCEEDRGGVRGDSEEDGFRIRGEGLGSGARGLIDGAVMARTADAVRVGRRCSIEFLTFAAGEFGGKSLALFVERFVLID